MVAGPEIKTWATLLLLSPLQHPCFLTTEAICWSLTTAVICRFIQEPLRKGKNRSKRYGKPQVPSPFSPPQAMDCLEYQNTLYLHIQLVSTCDRLGDVRWKLCVTDTSGKQHWCSADCFEVFKSSVCVRWYSLQLPPLPRLKTLQVFAFVPIFFNRKWKPHGDRSVPCCYRFFFVLFFFCFFLDEKVTRPGAIMVALQNRGVLKSLWICPCTQVLEKSFSSSPLSFKSKSN